MPRLFPTLCAGVWIAALVTVSPADEPHGPILADAPSPAAVLLARLGDDDPLVRKDATLRLIGLGESARPMLKKAMATANPQVRSQIDQVLLHVLWTRPGEPDEVTQALAGYADKDPDSRCTQIEGSIAPLGAVAANALLRIVLNDPSAAVRWSAADALRFTLQPGEALARQVIDASQDKADTSYLSAKENAPLLAIAGWAQRMSDPDHAEALFDRAVEMEIAYPSAFRTQSDFAFAWLADRRAMKKDYPAMIRLLREQAARTGWNPDGLPPAIAGLFAVQGEHGPLPGLAGDLRCYQSYLAYPEIMYSMGRMLHRHNHPVLGAMIDSIAVTMNGWSADSHYATGVFLLTQHWNAVARREIEWSISLSNGRNYTAYFALSQLAADQDDDLACAQNLELWLKQLHLQGAELPADSADLYNAEKEWHYLRASVFAKDQAKISEHLGKLMELDESKQVLQKDPGMAADIVPALENAGRNDEANRIFDSAYTALKAQVTAMPSDPMAKNNLAWLCACSGRKLDEAVSYADQAVAMNKEDAACLDTQAEVYFRVGRAKEAVEIEKRALAAKPEDAYMVRQVERFAAGVK